ncbi:MAG: methyltransferase domain-containing protein [Verrucomicrobiota bacterium]
MSSAGQLTKAQVSEGYDQIADRLQMSPKFYRLCFRLMRPHLKPGDTLVDLGCGQGRLLAEFAQGITGHFHGLDISFKLTALAKTRLDEALIVQGDVERLPWADAGFDAVLLTEVFEHLLAPQDALREIRRILKPQGHLLLTIPNRDWFRYESYQTERKRYQPVDDHWYSVSEVKEHLASAGFAVKRVRGAENLYFGGGLPRLLEKLALVVYPKLHERMKRALFVAQKK